MPYINFHDIDKDTLAVLDTLDLDGDLGMRAQNSSGETVTLLFKPDVIRALRDHLTAVLPATEAPAPEPFTLGEPGDVIVALRSRCCTKEGEEYLVDRRRDDYYRVTAGPGLYADVCFIDFEDAAFVRPAEGEFPEDDEDEVRNGIKVGDRVTVIDADDVRSDLGKTGTVTSIADPIGRFFLRSHPFRVQMDDPSANGGAGYLRAVSVALIEPAPDDADPFVSIRAAADGSITVSGTFPEDVVAALAGLKALLPGGMT